MSSLGLDEKKFLTLLRSHGMVLVRQHKHAIYRHPDGRSFVTSKTPSDRHAIKQHLRTLERFLGLR